MNIFINKIAQGIKELKNNSKTDEDFNENVNYIIKHLMEMRTCCDEMFVPMIDTVLIMLENQLI